MHSSSISQICLGKVYESPLPSSLKKLGLPYQELQNWVESQSDKRCNEAAHIIKQCWENKDTKLNLTGYNLAGLPDRVWMSFSWLEELYISNTNVSTYGIPEGIRYLLDLKVLDISHNPLRKINNFIYELSQLETLKANNSQLEEVGGGIGLLWKLTALDVSDNPFKEFPVELTEAPVLRRLDCANCGLTTLPEEIGEMRELQHLNLSGNHLAELPRTIGRLENLVILDLEKNQFAYCSEGIGRLKKLKEIALLYNPLNNFPIQLTSLSSLEKFTVDRELKETSLNNRFYKHLEEKGHLFGFILTSPGIFERRQEAPTL